MGTSSESKLDVLDEDVVKEETFVNTAFDAITPSNRQGISLIVSNISKVLFGKYVTYTHMTMQTKTIVYISVVSVS